MTNMTIGNRKTAQALERLADGLQKQIEQKMNPAIRDQNYTARRVRIASSMYNEGLFLQKIQNSARALSEMHRSNSVPYVPEAVKSSNVRRFLLC